MAEIQSPKMTNAGLRARVTFGAKPREGGSTNRPHVTPFLTYAQPNDNSPLRHTPAGCYIVCIRRSSESSRRSREGSNPFSPWEKARMRVRGIGNATKCNRMQLN